MTSPPTEITLLAERIDRLITALQETVKPAPSADPDLRLYSPAEAGALLGKTEHWVTKAIQDRRIPFTRVGQTPLLTAAHIRAVIADGEVVPNKFAKKLAAKPTASQGKRPAARAA